MLWSARCRLPCEAIRPAKKEEIASTSRCSAGLSLRQQSRDFPGAFPEGKNEAMLPRRGSSSPATPTTSNRAVATHLSLPDLHHCVVRPPSTTTTTHHLEASPRPPHSSAGESRLPPIRAPFFFFLDPTISVAVPLFPSSAAWDSLH
jgi:hypothetical protein